MEVKKTIVDCFVTECPELSSRILLVKEKPHWFCEAHFDAYKPRPEGK